MSPEEGRAECKVSTGEASREELRPAVLLPCDGEERGEVKAGRALPKGFGGGLQSWGPALTPAPPEFTLEPSAVLKLHGLP